MEKHFTFSSWSLTTIYLFVYFEFYFLRDGIWVTIMWLANRCRLEHEYQGKLIIPLQPNISMHILHTALYKLFIISLILVTLIFDSGVM